MCNMDTMMLALLDISVAVLTIAVSIPLLKDKIKMNWWYGVRFPKSFKSDENWYAMNRYGGKRLIFWSVVLIVIVLLVLVLPLRHNVKFLPLLLAPFIYIVPFIECLRFSRKL